MDYESISPGSNPGGEATDDEDEVTYELPRPVYQRDLKPPAPVTKSANVPRSNRGS